MTDKTLIDGTANPDSLGPDAMRWTPEPEQPAVSVVDIFGDVIHGYSRADALADGVLIAVGDDVAREAGFGVPVALTAAAWADCVAWSDESERTWLLATCGPGDDREPVLTISLPDED